MRFTEFMSEQQIGERVERVSRPAVRRPRGNGPTTAGVPRGTRPRIAEFELLVHAMGGEELVVFRTPVEPPEHARALLEVLGAVVVIDPAAPPIKWRK